MAGEGRAPETHHLLKVAKAASIRLKLAQTIIDEVRAVVTCWPEFAEEAGLPAPRARELDRILNGHGFENKSSS